MTKTRRSKDNHLLSKRIIQIYDTITIAKVMDIEQQIIELLAINKKPIHLHINTYGGDVYAALGLYDYIKSLEKVEVRTYNKGACMSAGTLIYLAGDQRYTTDRARFMFHKPRSYVEGVPEDFKIESDEMTAIYNDMLDIYEEETGIKRKVWKNLMSEGDYYIKGVDAHKMGVANEVSNRK